RDAKKPKPAPYYCISRELVKKKIGEGAPADFGGGGPVRSGSSVSGSSLPPPPVAQELGRVLPGAGASPSGIRVSAGRVLCQAWQSTLGRPLGPHPAPDAGLPTSAGTPNRRSGTIPPPPSASH